MEGNFYLRAHFPTNPSGLSPSLLGTTLHPLILMLGGDLCLGSGEVSRKKEPWEAGQDLLYTRTYMLGKQSLPSQPLHRKESIQSSFGGFISLHPQPPPATHTFFLNLSTSWKFEKWKEGYRNPCRLGEAGHSFIEARVLKPGPLERLLPYVKDVKVLI